MNDRGIVSRRSPHSVDDTIARVKTLLDAKQIALFALIDHSGEAAKAGLAMRPTKLVVFGNPRAGTPAMTVAPSLAIDLPLKLLVWEDEQGAAWVSYNSLGYLVERHGVPRDLAQPLAAVEALAAAATAEQ
jgi:uncharacterized protein (DUF302 family)